jgi:protein SCO1
MQDQSMQRRRRMLLSGVLLSPLMAPWLRAIAADEDMSGHDHSHHHHHMAAADDVRRSESAYVVPAMTLVRQDGAVVQFPQAMNDGRPVLLNFIYTSCTAICPMTSQVFSKVQATLAAAHEDAHLVSISIDPEYDTPARLAAYGKRFAAGSDWQFYTGTQAASIAMQKAFDVYRGDKMNHAPVSFLRAARGTKWVRLDGFASPNELVREYHLLSKQA